MKAVVVDMGAALSDPDKGKQTDRNEKRKAVKPSESKLPAKKGKRDLFKNSEDTSKLQTNSGGVKPSTSKGVKGKTTPKVKDKTATVVRLFQMMRKWK